MRDQQIEEWIMTPETILEDLEGYQRVSVEGIFCDRMLKNFQICLQNHENGRQEEDQGGIEEAWKLLRDNTWFCKLLKRVTGFTFWELVGRDLARAHPDGILSIDLEEPQSPPEIFKESGLLKERPNFKNLDIEFLLLYSDRRELPEASWKHLKRHFRFKFYLGANAKIFQTHTLLKMAEMHQHAEPSWIGRAFWQLVADPQATDMAIQLHGQLQKEDIFAGLTQDTFCTLLSSPRKNLASLFYQLMNINGFLEKLTVQHVIYLWAAHREGQTEQLDLLKVILACVNVSDMERDLIIGRLDNNLLFKNKPLFYEWLNGSNDFDRVTRDQFGMTTPLTKQQAEAARPLVSLFF